MPYKPFLVPRLVLIETLYTALRRDLPPGSMSSGEAHNFWELFYVLSGEVTVTIGRDVRILRAGDMVLHLPMQFHHHRALGNEDTEILVLSFDANGIPPFKDYIFSLGEEEREHLVEIFNRIMSAYKVVYPHVVDVAQDDFSAAIAVKELETFLCDVFSNAKNNQQTNLPHLPEKEDFAKIVAFLYDHITESLSVPEIAHASNLGLSTLKRLFSRFAGVGVMTYFEKLKITHAAKMIAAGARIGDTAAHLGFNSLSTFSIAFRRVMGVSPSAFRKNVRTNS